MKETFYFYKITNINFSINTSYDFINFLYKNSKGWGRAYITNNNDIYLIISSPLNKLIVPSKESRKKLIKFILSRVIIPECDYNCGKAYGVYYIIGKNYVEYEKGMENFLKEYRISPDSLKL